MSPLLLHVEMQDTQIGTAPVTAWLSDTNMALDLRHPHGLQRYQEPQTSKQTQAAGQPWSIVLLG